MINLSNQETRHFVFETSVVVHGSNENETVESLTKFGMALMVHNISPNKVAYGDKEHMAKAAQFFMALGKSLIEEQV